MSTLRGLFGIAILMLGIWAFWTVAQGLITGDIVQFSKRGHDILHRNLSPERYWIAIAFWSIGSLMLVGWGFKMAKDNLNPS